MYLIITYSASGCTGAYHPAVELIPHHEIALFEKHEGLRKRVEEDVEGGGGEFGGPGREKPDLVYGGDINA
jgi:hypothetical protein